MKQEIYIELGIIKQIRGLKGYVLAHIEPELKSFHTITYIFMKIGHTYVPYQIEEASLNYHQAILKLQDIDNREAAQGLINQIIWLPEKIANKIIPKEALPSPLIGYEVEDIHEGKLGTIKRIDKLSIQSCLVVAYLNYELLIPYEKALIKHIDPASKHILVHLPTGFLEAVGYK